MSVKPPKLLRVRVTSIVPLASWDIDDGTNDPWLYHDYRWTIEMSVDPQPHGYHLSQTPYEYNGLDLQVGDWVATSDGGVAVQITNIVAQTATTATCEVEDIDRYNIFSDPTVSGVGIGPTGLGYVFELNDDGMPVLTPVASGVLSKEFQSDLMGRFADRNLKRRYVRVNQANHGLALDAVIWLNPATGLYGPALGSDATSSERVVGIVRDIETYPTNHNLDWFAYEPIGKLVNDISLPGSVGDLVYLSGTVAGGYTNVKPTPYAKPLYIKLGSDRGLLIERDMTSSTSSGGGGGSSTTVVANVAARDALIPNNGDQVFVQDNGNTEWAMYLYNNGEWTNITNKDASASDSNTYSVSLTPFSASPMSIATVSNGSRVILLTVTVDTAFNGSPAVLTVGDSEVNDRLLSDAECDINAMGTYEVNPAHQYSSGGDVTIKAYFDLKGSTVGSVRITLTYA